MLISKFDPWESKVCTCPSKLTLNPYTGCTHQCTYCYVTSYIPNFFECRPKKDLLNRLEREAFKLNGQLVSISNSSDPYPSLEEELGLTRKVLEIFAKHNCRIQIITKSPLVTRDVDILKRMPSMVCMTITTFKEQISKLLEPKAPPPLERLCAVKMLIENDIPVCVRLDPVIPYVNDEPTQLIESLASIGVSQITSSTYKVKQDNWKRFSTAFPEIAEKLRPYYFERGERISRYYYLPKTLRLELMKKIKELTENNNMKFATCREGLGHVNTATCDGSWMINQKHERKSTSLMLRQ